MEEIGTDSWAFESDPLCSNEKKVFDFVPIFLIERLLREAGNAAAIGAFQADAIFYR